MSKQKSSLKPAVEQSPQKALTLEGLRITWPREDLLAEKVRNVPGEITGQDLARILGILDHLRCLGEWKYMLDENHARCLLLGVEEILVTVVGTYSELGTDGLSLIQHAVEQANAILNPRPLPGPEAFTVHLAAAPAA